MKILKSKKETDTPECFWIDENKLASEKNEYTRALRMLQKAIDAWTKITEFEILPDELEAIRQNPKAVYVAKIEAVQENAEKELRKMFGNRANTAALMESIYLPKNFREVEAAFEDCNFKMKFFTIKEGKAELSEEVNSRIISRTHYFIENGSQRKRLDFAKRLAAMLTDELKDFLINDIEQHPHAELNQFKGNIEDKAYAGALPTGVISVYTNDRKVIIPDPHWVVNGYASTYDILAPVKDIKEPTPIKYRIAYHRDLSGFDRPVLFIEGTPVPLDPLRQIQTTLLPFIYHIVNGTPQIQSERGKRYPDNPLVFQPDSDPKPRFI